MVSRVPTQRFSGQTKESTKPWAVPFEALRRFEKRFHDAGHPTATVTSATLTRVASRLAGIVPECPCRSIPSDLPS